MDLNLFQNLNIYQLPSPYLEILAGLIGLCVGSFLNVLSLRTLKDESIWRKRSYCDQCMKPLGVMELIPVLSYFMQKGTCKHCQAKIHWQYPLVEAATALTFAAIVHFLGPTYWTAAANFSDLEITATILAMLFFASTLIAVCITDFREKLIPHEITYPAIILGIIYSTVIRHDLLGTLAGIGASYLIFDFIDHFGVQFYYWTHPGFKERNEPETDVGIDDEIDFTMEVGYLRADEADEPFMVMGGGDAVLSALIAAWLGWQKLIPALIIGFLVGAIMGGLYLLVELRKERMLAPALKRFILGFLSFAGVMALAMLGLDHSFPQSGLWSNPATYLLIFSLGFGGGTIGIMTAPGPKMVKHFPFGPALAVGAIFAIFLITTTGDSFMKAGPY